jgi:hypothetical protein
LGGSTGINQESKHHPLQNLSFEALQKSHVYENNMSITGMFSTPSKSDLHM